jgi:hypothetical protein
MFILYCVHKELNFFPALPLKELFIAAFFLYSHFIILPPFFVEHFEERKRQNVELILSHVEP